MNSLLNEREEMIITMERKLANAVSEFELMEINSNEENPTQTARVGHNPYRFASITQPGLKMSSLPANNVQTKDMMPNRP